METLLEYKEGSGLSYRAIAEQAGIGDRTGAFYACHKPYRCRKDRIILVAGVLGMPTEDAIEEWKNSKIDRLKNSLE
jgi:hypothetical protein